MTTGDIVWTIAAGIACLICGGVVAWNELIARPRRERRIREIEAQRRHDVREWLDR